MTVLIKKSPSKTRLSKISPRKTGGAEVKLGRGTLSAQKLAAGLASTLPEWAKPREEEDPYRYFDGAGFKDDERDDDRD